MEEDSWGGIVGEEGNTEPPKAAEEKSNGLIGVGMILLSWITD